MKTFNQFNESIRDKMTPKSEEDIKKSLDKILTPESKLHKIYLHNLQHLFTDEEIKKILNELHIEDKIKNIFDYKLQHLFTEEEIISDIVETILNNYKKNTLSFHFSNYMPKIYIDNVPINGRLKSQYGNNTYLHIEKEYKLEFKEFCWDKNIAFSEISETEYKIMSTDKIKQLLSKLVKDVFNQKTFTFSIRRLN